MKSIDSQNFIDDYLGGGAAKHRVLTLPSGERISLGPDRQFWRFVTYDQVERATLVQVSLASDAGKILPNPFKHWTWRGVSAPGSKKWGVLDAWRVHVLRRFLRGGGILLLAGGVRTGKTRLLKWICQGGVLSAPHGDPDRTDALVGIDDFRLHMLDGVMRVVDRLTTSNKGFGIAIGNREEFIQSGLSVYIADRRVLVLELLTLEESEPILRAKQW